ncbi:MAG: hydrogenase formation protein HypD [Candidatus Omnitrophota bacterium]
MKYIDEFRKSRVVKRVSQKIFEIMPDKKLSIMEVCGTHTQSFHRFSLNTLIPKNLRLIAGPGCPVCVSDQDYIDRAIQLSKEPDTIIVSFGDMLRVPGTGTSLEKQRAGGSDVRIVYSPWDSLKIAKDNPGKRVVFLAVGFETTIPTLALTLLAAKKEKLKNFFFFCALKVIPSAMEALISDRALKIDGFLCPGHVSTIIGTQAYEFIAKKYKIACCVAGFEPLDILEGIHSLIWQIVNKKPKVGNQYLRVVKRHGNPKAKAIINKVFRTSSAVWRGIGEIPGTGMKLRDEFARFDIEKIMPLEIKHKKEDKKIKRCRCGDVLKGIIQPFDCPLFRKACSPLNPYGPCMVSSEGTCNAYYRYK